MLYVVAKRLKQGDQVTVVIRGIDTITTVDNVSDDALSKTVYVSVRTKSGTFYACIPNNKLK